ncbi:MAG: D-cysteine desulfhydrase family protein [Candidatus Bathyarchaeia archaeon]
MKLGTLPRVKLTNLPTPLQEAPNLSKALGGPRILVKRDDLTGLAFGGNKTRKLEFLMADALREGADVIVTGAGFQSNWCTQSAAAARRLGMKCVLIKSGPVDGYDPEDYDGNHLLHFLMGAEIKVATGRNTRKVYDETMEELREKGHRPHLLTAAGSTPPGVMGYVNAVLELASQAVEQGIKIDYLVHASGSGGTMAGLVLGAKALNTGIEIIGAAVSPGKERMVKNVTRLVNESAGYLGVDLAVNEDEITVYDEYAGPGYGVLTDEKAEAVKIAAETEGLFLDPVYTGTSMAALIGLSREGVFKADDTVVFLHTGGSAALFPYRSPLKAYGVGKPMPWRVPPWAR